MYDIKVTIEMDAEIFDQFRAFQKDANSIGSELREDLRSLGDKHERLCSTLLDSLEVPTYPAEPPQAPGIVVKDERKLLEAVELAADWFC